MAGGLTVEQAEAFWQAFRAQELWLAGLPPDAFVREAGALLAQQTQGLSLELDSRPCVYTPHKRAVRITAHGNSARFRDVQLLVRHASGLSLHGVQAFRSRVPPKRFALQNADLQLSTHQVWVCQHAHDGLVGLEVALPPLAPEQHPVAQRMVHEMLGHVLGEWDLAIRVGRIDFVAELPKHRLPCPVHEYAGFFDDFSASRLGYSTIFPVEDEGPWRPQPLLDACARPQALWLINLGAKTVAMQPELGHAVWLGMPVWEDEDLQRAQAVQHAVAMQLQRERAGVLAMVLLEEGDRRTALYYASDPQDVVRVLHEVDAQAPAQWGAEWSPRWTHYREALNLQTELAQEPDSFFQQLGLL